MEKIKTKCNKRKTLQITYPAPYSHSWNPDVLPVLMKNSVGRNNSLFQGRKSSTGRRPWIRSYSTSDRPDPTAPHLKYGVFRNRRGQPGPINPIKSSPVKPKRKTQIQQVIKVPVERTRKKSSITKQITQYMAQSAVQPTKKKLVKRPKSPPVLVIRNVDRNFSRNLSLSKVMHVDIKPRWMDSLSPSYCPSPNFKTLPRKYAVSPTKLKTFV